MNLQNYQTQDLHFLDAQEIMHKSKMCIFSFNIKTSLPYQYNFIAIK
jgi:hypothetical protein